MLVQQIMDFMFYGIILFTNVKVHCEFLIGITICNGVDQLLVAGTDSLKAPDRCPSRDILLNIHRIEILVENGMTTADDTYRDCNLG